MWSLPETGNALGSRDLASILRVYRRLNGMSQERLAVLLGYDKTYISMIETGRRVISDVDTRHQIARALGLPAHVLGVTDTSDADLPHCSSLARALAVAEQLEDQAFLAHALRMHGNELRKADRSKAAVARLIRAVELSTNHEGRGVAYALLARAAGEVGNQAVFDKAIDGFRALLDGDGERSMLFNPFVLREVRLRGLISSGRTADAIRLMENGRDEMLPVAPQWYIIERVTAGQVYHRLPHQIQRAVRAAEKGGLVDVVVDGRTALRRLNELLRPVLEVNVR